MHSLALHICDFIMNIFHSHKSATNGEHSHKIATILNFEGNCHLFSSDDSKGIVQVACQYEFSSIIVYIASLEEV